LLLAACKNVNKLRRIPETNGIIDQFAAIEHSERVLALGLEGGEDAGTMRTMRETLNKE